MRHKLVGGKQEASICRCYMVQSRKCMYLCICSSIFDTVEDCSRTGCGLETDRVWLSLSVCACVCSSFFLSLSEAEWKGTQIKAVYFLLREEKGEWAALLCPPLRSLPPECQAHEWLRGGGEEEEEGGWVAQLCFVWTPLLLSHERDCGARLGFVSVFMRSRRCPAFNRCEDNWAPTVFMF